MDRFWELMEQSVIVQGIVTLVFVVTACIIMAQGNAVPELLQAALMLILGWYFGSKTQQVMQVAARKVIDGRNPSSSGDSGDDSA